jgi:hypothetical protein
MQPQDRPNTRGMKRLEFLWRQSQAMMREGENSRNSFARYYYEARFRCSHAESRVKVDLLLNSLDTQSVWFLI